jgi:hypothetical protein
MPLEGWFVYLSCREDVATTKHVRRERDGNKKERLEKNNPGKEGIGDQEKERKNKTHGRRREEGAYLV